MQSTRHTRLNGYLFKTDAGPYAPGALKKERVIKEQQYSVRAGLIIVNKFNNFYAIGRLEQEKIVVSKVDQEKRSSSV